MYMAPQVTTDLLSFLSQRGGLYSVTIDRNAEITP